MDDCGQRYVFDSLLADLGFKQLWETLLNGSLVCGWVWFDMSLFWKWLTYTPQKLSQCLRRTFQLVINCTFAAPQGPAKFPPLQRQGKHEQRRSNDSDAFLGGLFSLSTFLPKEFPVAWMVCARFLKWEAISCQQRVPQFHPPMLPTHRFTSSRRADLVKFFRLKKWPFP